MNAKAYNSDTARSLALINGNMKIVSLIDNHVMPITSLRAEAGKFFVADISEGKGFKEFELTTCMMLELHVLQKVVIVKLPLVYPFLYPFKQTCVGLLRNHPVCLSVCLILFLVCPSSP